MLANWWGNWCVSVSMLSNLSFSDSLYFIQKGCRREKDESNGEELKCFGNLKSQKYKMKLRIYFEWYD